MALPVQPVNWRKSIPSAARLQTVRQAEPALMQATTMIPRLRAGATVSTPAAATEQAIPTVADRTVPAALTARGRALLIARRRTAVQLAHQLAGAMGIRIRRMRKRRQQARGRALEREPIPTPALVFRLAAPRATATNLAHFAGAGTQ